MISRATHIFSKNYLQKVPKMFFLNETGLLNQLDINLVFEEKIMTPTKLVKKNMKYKEYYNLK